MGGTSVGTPWGLGGRDCSAYPLTAACGNQYTVVVLVHSLEFQLFDAWWAQG